jgi:hypothetical protein
MAETKTRKKATPAQARPGCFFCAVAGPQLEALFENALPENTREHFKSSRVEFLKGIRSMLDARIAQLSDHPRKGTKVAVE